MVPGTVFPMKKALKWVGIASAVLVVSAGVFYGWASSKASALGDRVLDSHAVDFPVPFPLTDAEVDVLRGERVRELEAEAPPAPEATEPLRDPLDGVDLDAIAVERAVARGEHLVKARYACTGCHGADFSGGEMINDPALAVVLGPNLTAGRGGRVENYDMADWDRAVRHGILPDGRPSLMPSEDYLLMSDGELSDIIAYLRTVDPVDNEVAEPTFGPAGTVFVALGELSYPADRIEDHQAAHRANPPPAEPTAEFGRHLAGVCTGCHREDFSGGPIAAGDPDWIPGANLTKHADGLEGWSFEDFVTALRDLRRPDGSEIRYPMTMLQPYAAEMTDTELQALWAYVGSLDARPTGQ